MADEPEGRNGKVITPKPLAHGNTSNHTLLRATTRNKISHIGILSWIDRKTAPFRGSATGAGVAFLDAPCFEARFFCGCLRCRQYLPDRRTPFCLSPKCLSRRISLPSARRSATIFQPLTPAEGAGTYMSVSRMGLSRISRGPRDMASGARRAGVSPHFLHFSIDCD